jgi:RNA polymerase sigma-70 factor (ECF subfamily)
VSDDFALLESWRQGDAKAGSALLRRHFDSLQRFFINKVGDDASDLIQRTMEALVKSRDRFRGDSSFRTYMFVIARNELYGHLRKLRRERALFDPQAHSIHDIGTSPSKAVEVQRENKLLFEGLRRLPVDLQVALELFYWEGMEGADLAAVLDIPLGTVKSRLRRGKELLRKHMERLAKTGAELEQTRGNLEDWARGVKQGLANEGAGV